MPLSEIAREAGTLVYVYSTATIRHHARVMKDALAPLGDPLIAYAVMVRRRIDLADCAAMPLPQWLR